MTDRLDKSLFYNYTILHYSQTMIRAFRNSILFYNYTILHYSQTLPLYSVT